MRTRFYWLAVVFLGLAIPLNAKKTTTPKATAEWTIVAYVQADNNLAPFASYNINDMQLAPLTDSVNMLVEWDQPNNNKTWRYRIVKGGRIEDASLSAEMGLHPVQELVDMMAWAKAKYSAKKYATILWNHGSGVLDPRFRPIDKLFKLDQHAAKVPKQTVPWLEIPGLGIQKKYNPEDPRGILFDDSQNTYATNQDLSTAFARIKTEVLGKNIDLVGMDACLMAMIEVGYQIKDSVNILVGSEETEPGEGFAYSIFLTSLCTAPTKYGAVELATAMVNAYGSFYKGRETDFTQSAMDLTKLDAIKQNIDLMISKVAVCKRLNTAQTKSIIHRARVASTSFAVSDYIDLSSFYTAMATQLKKSTARLQHKNITTSKDFAKAITDLLTVISSGQTLITNAIIANAAGAQFSSSVKGISIYYPLGSVYSSYPSTTFAQTSQWLKFITEYK
jgi:hypothetical protein